MHMRSYIYKGSYYIHGKCPLNIITITPSHFTFYYIINYIANMQCSQLIGITAESGVT